MTACRDIDVGNRRRTAAFWVTAATAGAAAVNYLYTLLLTLALDGREYADFAAAQGLCWSGERWPAPRCR